MPYMILVPYQEDLPLPLKTLGVSLFCLSLCLLSTLTQALLSPDYKGTFLYTAVSQFYTSDSCDPSYGLLPLKTVS